MNDIKLLLVDDEEDYVKALAERLNLRNLSSSTALNGMQAIESVNNSEPDVMVLDLKMPGIDGMEVLQRVRNNYPDIQVIIQTGYGDDFNEEGTRRLESEIEELKVFDYLRKPVDIEVLVERIKAAARNKGKITD